MRSTTTAPTTTPATIPTTDPSATPGRTPGSFRPAAPTVRRRRRAAVALLGPLAVATAACAGPSAAADAPEHGGAHGQAHVMSTADQAAAMLATAGFQDVATAEAAGYASSIDTLGCFQHAQQGGMGVHWIDGAALDGTLDIRHPEALVYELGADGEVTGLVAHEYIVPVDAWTSSKPPALFGMELHRHPVLPLWVLHTWLWKDNPVGMFADWNPAVRQCPAGVPVFGVDLP